MKKMLKLDRFDDDKNEDADGKEVRQGFGRVAHLRCDLPRHYERISANDLGLTNEMVSELLRTGNSKKLVS